MLANAPLIGGALYQDARGDDIGLVWANMVSAERAGARIVKAAHETFFGGYSGYFQDPDGHLWEVVWNPAWSA